MISDATRDRINEAIHFAHDYCSGAKRKQLQSTYDKMLDEISNSIFNEPCTNRMAFRQKVNRMTEESNIINALKRLLMNQEHLFRKDYRNYTTEIEKFLTNDMAHFLGALSDE